MHSFGHRIKLTLSLFLDSSFLFDFKENKQQRARVRVADVGQKRFCSAIQIALILILTFILDSKGRAWRHEQRWIFIS